MNTEHSELRELSPSEIEEILRRCSHAHLGCSRRGEIYVVPLTYVYEDGIIYSHSLPGKKLEMMRANPDVCLQVEEIKSLFDWVSVIIWGRFQELKDGTEAERGLRLLKMKICEILHRKDVTPLEVELDAILSEAKIYRINIDRISGRAEKSNSEGVSPWNQNLESSLTRLS
jgi:nitroimidazol reductase NimA-like FMN-containing flavoprotein (pyridoxamine 5'-phosphate oxidase superfamily)